MARRNEEYLLGPASTYTGPVATNLGRRSFTMTQKNEESRRLPPGAIYQASWVPPSMLSEPAPATEAPMQALISPRQRNFASAFALAQASSRSKQLAEEYPQTHIAAAAALRYPRGRADLSPRYHHNNSHFEPGAAQRLKAGVRYGWAVPGGLWTLEENPTNVRFQ